MDGGIGVDPAGPPAGPAAPRGRRGPRRARRRPSGNRPLWPTCWPATGRRQRASPPSCCATRTAGPWASSTPAPRHGSCGRWPPPRPSPPCPTPSAPAPTCPNGPRARNSIQYLAQLEGQEYAVVDRDGTVTGLLRQSAVLGAITGKVPAPATPEPRPEPVELLPVVNFRPPTAQGPVPAGMSAATQLYRSEEHLHEQRHRRQHQPATPAQPAAQHRHRRSAPAPRTAAPGRRGAPPRTVPRRRAGAAHGRARPHEHDHASKPAGPSTRTAAS